ncbi:MAG: hypothetical protein EOO88_01240 [Pedobacter sp.]|nr:MAG: hypothetical protein EOO88_01240 [Pedobacter sp.]
MNKIFLTVIFAFVTLESSSQAGKKTPDLKSVLNGVLEARGGSGYLRSINTFYAEMLNENRGRFTTWITKEMVPNRGAVTILDKDSILYDSWFNGKEAFEIVDGKKREREPGYSAQKRPRKNIFTELDYLDSTLWSMELLPDEIVDGNPCFQVKGTFITRESRLLYIDKGTFRIIKQEDLNLTNGQVELTSYFSDFKKFGDFIFYSTVYFVSEQSISSVKVVRVLINEAVSKTDFEK